MIVAKFEDDRFYKEMNNILDYAAGFLEGARYGKTKFLDSLGRNTVEELKEFIDANARMDPEALHHVYEWYRVGSPEARLFEIEHTVSNLGLSIKSNFTQSSSIKEGSSEPFYNKAAIMESGAKVRISPKTSNMLVFEVDGKTVFTPNEVVVDNPGGDRTTGAYEQVFDLFMNKYFSQSYLMSSGISARIKRPEIFKSNLKAGARGGKSVGFATGYRWIANLEVA